jgi:hypothetical protein
MSDERDTEKKPVTLADYIPPATHAKKPKRRGPSDADRKRLAELERAVRETEPDAVHRSSEKRGKTKHKGRLAESKGWKRPNRANQPRHSKVGKNGLVVWAILFMILVAFFWD